MDSALSAVPSLTVVQPPPTAASGLNRPSVQRQDSLEPFARIATTTEDPLSAITPTLGFASPAEATAMNHNGGTAANLSGVRHDHQSLHSLPPTTATVTPVSTAIEQADSFDDSGIEGSEDALLGGDGLGLPTPNSEVVLPPFTPCGGAFEMAEDIGLSNVKTEQLDPTDDWQLATEGALTPELWPGSNLPSFSAAQYGCKDNGPTLAALNSTDDLWDFIDFGDLLNATNQAAMSNDRPTAALQRSNLTLNALHHYSNFEKENIHNSSNLNGNGNGLGGSQDSFNDLVTNGLYAVSTTNLGSVDSKSLDHLNDLMCGGGGAGGGGGQRQPSASYPIMAGKSNLPGSFQLPGSGKFSEYHQRSGQLSKAAKFAAPAPQSLNNVGSQTGSISDQLQQLTGANGGQSNGNRANQLCALPSSGLVTSAPTTIQTVQVPAAMLSAKIAPKGPLEQSVVDGSQRAKVLGSLLNAQNQSPASTSALGGTNAVGSRTTITRSATGSCGAGQLKRPKVSFPTTLITASSTATAADDSSSPDRRSAKRQHTDENNNRVRNSSMSSSDGQASVSSHDEEGFASQPDDESEEEDETMLGADDSDDESFYGDYEAKDLIGASTSDDINNKWALNMGRARKGGAQRYFWQYNVQSKGPKGARLSATTSADNDGSDPHVLQEAYDPVFAEDCQVEGVKHAGKARRGDGNDLTPNPRKLLMIGLELKKLSKVINDLTPVAEVPVSARNKSRKEKNKLASRACRLKKKAQHEANKIKLFGLNQEHRKLMQTLADIKKQVRKHVESAREKNQSQCKVAHSVEQVFQAKAPSTHVAGRTADFVNSILDEVAKGQTNGGLEKL